MRSSANSCLVRDMNYNQPQDPASILIVIITHKRVSVFVCLCEFLCSVELKKQMAKAKGFEKQRSTRNTLLIYSLAYNISLCLGSALPACLISLTRFLSLLSLSLLSFARSHRSRSRHENAHVHDCVSLSLSVCLSLSLFLTLSSPLSFSGYFIFFFVCLFIRMFLFLSISFSSSLSLELLFRISSLSFSLFSLLSFSLHTQMHIYLCV